MKIDASLVQLENLQKANKAQIFAVSDVSQPSSSIEADNITLSIPFHSADKNLATQLLNLIRVLNKLEFHDAGGGLTPTKEGQPQWLPFLELLFYKGEEDPLSFVKTFIEKSGLLYEAKISKDDINGFEDDLKGFLLKVIEKQGEKTEPGQTATTLVNDIESKQLFNARGKGEGVFHLQVPVLLPQGGTTAEVFVRRDGNGKGEYKGDSHRVGFSIELGEAGLVSVDAIVSRNKVSIRLQVEKPEFLEFMKTELPKLSERLSGNGLITSFE